DVECLSVFICVHRRLIMLLPMLYCTGSSSVLLSTPLMVTRNVTVPVIEPSSRNCTASIPQRPATANACSAAMAAWPTCTVTASTMEEAGDGGIGKPSGRACAAGPNPVPYTVSNSPDRAGASAV